MPKYFNPTTNNPEIHPAKPAGYLTEEEWIINHPYVPVPRTQEELWDKLRGLRDYKLAETDFMLMPDYPIDNIKLEKVKEYRQALRDLPGIDGAPWDGGGDDTPWPEKDF